MSAIVLWLLFAAMTAGVTGMIVRPLAARYRKAENHVKDVHDVHMQQIRDDAVRGVLGEPEAEALKNEARRRLLSAVREDTSSDRPVRHIRAVAVGVAFFIMMIAAGLYGTFGRPDLPERLKVRSQGALVTAGMETLVARMEAQLQRQPEDVEGWRLIAPAYIRLGRYEEAIRAYKYHAQLGGEQTPAMLAGLGEALTLANGGQVTPPARIAFETALARDDTHPSSRFYLGLALAQEGNFSGALAVWSMLRAATRPDDPWYAPLNARIREAEEALQAAEASQKSKNRKP